MEPFDSYKVFDANTYGAVEILADIATDTLGGEFQIYQGSKILGHIPIPKNAEPVNVSILSTSYYIIVKATLNADPPEALCYLRLPYGKETWIQWYPIDSSEDIHIFCYIATFEE